MTPTPDEPGPEAPPPFEIEDLLDRLRRASILYRAVPEGSGNGVIYVAVAGARWEIEYFADAPIEVEVFISSGEVEGEAALERLFEAHSDKFPRSVRQSHDG